MNNNWSRHLHAKTRRILTLFHISFFTQHLAFTVSGTLQHRYNAPENILVACGSNESFLSQDQVRTWIGDIDSSYFLQVDPQNNASTVSDAPHQQASSICDPVYLNARLSYKRFTYVFNLTAGPKFIRLYFCPTLYPNFDSSKAFFSVTAASFTLLRNFSASLTASAHGQKYFFKEFCINVQEGQRLNISFIPSQDYRNAYAFINGIEIVSMPQDLYYTPATKPIVFVGEVNRFYIENSNALETVYRINVGGSQIPPQYDTGMYRTWYAGIGDYLTVGVIPRNTTFEPKFIAIHDYTAPAVLYQTAISMGPDKNNNVKYGLTWEFPVDSGFKYFVRLHFCEFEKEITKVGDRVFQIDIADQTAEPFVDIIGWTGDKGNGIPIYRDYAAMIVRKGDVKRQNLSIALHPAAASTTVYSDAILNGIEIFKVDENRNLAGPNPDPLTGLPSVPSPSRQSTKSANNHATIIGIVGGLASGFVVISLLIFFIFRRARKVKDSGSSTGASFFGPFSFSTTKSSKSRGSSLPSDLCTHFSLSVIKAATNDFDDIFIIGVGGFGNVYKGYINSGVTPVAIKRLNPGSQQGALEFNTEIEMLSQLRHLHLVSLIGYCNDYGEMILVYDYMAHGTLRDHLYNSDNPPLPWNQRLKICIGAARGLHYLHTGTKHGIIHRDVKTTNILLDDKWVAKVSDFGLSKTGPTTMSKAHVSTVVKGSIGYLDPEYYRLQRLTEKSDVYSFGVVLFEVLCARPPVLRTVDKNEVSLAFWAQQCYNNGTLDQIVDPILKGKIVPECLKKFAEIAMSCLNDNGIRRPSMSDVVWGLEFALQLQETSEVNDKPGHNEDHRKKAPLVDEEMPPRNVDDASDIDSGVLSSSIIGDHVLESRTSISTVTLTISDDQSFSTKRSDSKAIFSEIMNPQGR